MSDTNCMERATLKSYLAGSVDEPLISEIESHLSICEACERTVIELASDPDTLVELVHGIATPYGTGTSTSDLATLNPPSSVSNSLGSGAKSVEQPSVIARAVDAARNLLLRPAVLPNSNIGQMLCIDAYEIMRSLGQGGMGTVYLARHRQLGKQVAIKVLPGSIAGKPDLVNRFLREIKAAGRLNHPAIVSATDAGQENGIHYLVMEYVDGLDLSRVARLTGQLSIADACEVARQAALGLSHAHAEGVVHRDIKPSNLMLDSTGHVKILDFGLAQINLWDEAAAELTTVGQLMGTLDYMAPEQAERSGAVDYRADIYSLGAMLFRLICGRAPMAAAPNMSLLEKVRMLAEQSPPRLSSLRLDAPEELVRVVAQLLSRDPAERPASAAHVAELLASFCGSSNLRGLLDQAHSAAASRESDEAIVQPIAQAVAVRPAQPFRQDKPLRSRWSSGIVAALSLLLFVPAAAGILITLEYQKGQLVIKSDSADVQIRIAKGGQVVKELTIQSGSSESTRLRADKYEITLASPSNSISLDKNTFTIRNGETVVATVTQVDKSEPKNLPPKLSEKKQTNVGDERFAQELVNRFGGVVPLTASTPGAKQLLYNRVSLDEWLEILRTDRSTKSQQDALAAISALMDDPGTAAQITPVLLEILSSLITLREDSATEFLALEILRKAHPGKAYFKLIAGELSKHGENYDLHLIRRINLSKTADSNDVEPFFSQALALTSDSSTETRDAAVKYAVALAKSDEQRQRVVDMLKSNQIARIAYFCSTTLDRFPPFVRPLRKSAVIEAFQDLTIDPHSAVRSILAVSEYPTIPNISATIETRMQGLIGDKIRVRLMHPVRSVEDARSRFFAMNHLSINHSITPEALISSEMIELLDLAVAKNVVADLQPVLRKLADSNQSGQFSNTDFLNLSDQLELQHVHASFIWPSLELRNSSDRNTNELLAWNEASPELRMQYLISAYARSLLMDPAPKPDNTDQPASAIEKEKSGSPINKPANPSDDSNSKNLRQPESAKPQTDTSQSRSPDALNVPIYGGKTLDQWVNLFERDRNDAARSDALVAIGELAQGSRNRGLTEKLISIHSQRFPRSVSTSARHPMAIDVEPSHDMYDPNRVSLNVQLWRAIKKLNTPEVVSEILINRLLTTNDASTKHWLSVFISEYVFNFDNPQCQVIENWLLKPENVSNFDRNAAERMREFLLKALYSRKTISDEIIGRTMDSIQAHPNLGLYDVLTCAPARDTRNIRTFDPTTLKTELAIEDYLARLAIKYLTSDEDRPELLTVAACRIASGNGISQVEREKLVEALRKRLSRLVNNSERRCQIVTGKNVTVARRIIGLPKLPSTNSVPSEQTRSGSVTGSVGTRFVNSELLSYLALVERLGACNELAQELSNLFQKTHDAQFAVRVAELKENVSSPELGLLITWPVDQDSIDKLPGLLKAIPREIWNDRMMFEIFHQFLLKLPSSSDPIIAKSLDRYVNKVNVLSWDKDYDFRISASEAPARMRQGNQLDSSLDENSDGFLDPEEYTAAVKKLYSEPANSSLKLPPSSRNPREWAAQIVRRYDKNQDGRLTSDEWSSMVVKPDGADTNQDGAITVEEYSQFRESMRNR